MEHWNQQAYDHAWENIPQMHYNEVKAFDDELAALGRSLPTRVNYLKALGHLFKFVHKPLNKITKEDMVAWMNHARSTVPRSTMLYATLIRRFYKWWNKEAGYPATVNWMRTSKQREGRVIREDLLTREEFNRILRQAPSLKVQALLCVLADSGARPSEILSLRIRDVKEDEYGIAIRVHGKTGFRLIRLIDSVKDLQFWLERHPHPKDLNAWIFPGQGSNHYSLTALRDNLHHFSQKAGIQKRAYPYLLRHGRLTELAGSLSSAELKTHAGWRTDMSRVYVHLSGEDVGNKLLRIAGKIRGEEGTDPSFRCPLCGTESPRGSKYCNNCGKALGEL